MSTEFALRNANGLAAVRFFIVGEDFLVMRPRPRAVRPNRDPTIIRADIEDARALRNWLDKSLAEASDG